MSSCDEKFQRIQALQQEMEELRSSQVKLRAAMQADQDKVRSGLRLTEDLRADPDNLRAVEEGILNQEVTRLPDGNPINFSQMLREYPESLVQDYATVSRALMQTGQTLNPKDWAFLGKAPENVAKQLEELTKGGVSVQEALTRMMDDSDPFANAAERTARLRWWSEATKQSYISNLDEILGEVQASPGKRISPDLKRRTYQAWKLALMAERHYDHVRNQWGRMGQAMQGRGEGMDAVLSTFDDKTFDPAAVETELEQAIKLRPTDVGMDTPIGRVINAVDQVMTNPKEAAKQLATESAIAKLRVDPELRGKDWKTQQGLLLNLLAKDSQLTNIRTQTLNVTSNFNMALLGPYRAVYEDLAEIPMGTKFMSEALKVFEDHWAGYGAGLQALRESGKEVFLDVWKGNYAHFSSNLDAHGMFHDSVDKQLKDLEALLDRPSTGWAMIDPNRARAAMHAGTRLWMYETTKNPVVLRPGLTLLGAVDNVSGLFFHHYAYRTELQKTARRDAVKLGLKTQADIDAWVNKQYEDGFMSLEPSEEQIKAYRKSRNIPASMVSDTEVAQQIMDARAEMKYGAPLPINEAARKASAFSEEMRFQKKPDPGSVGEGAYNAINQLRKQNPVMDMLVPYLQSPFAGAGLDFNLLGVGPTVDLVRHMTGQRRLNAQQVRRLKANFAMAAQMWGAWAVLSASGAIVGNGPIDPKERQEWLAELKATGRQPNSIFGVPLIGGIPILSTFFLMEDIRTNLEVAMVSKHDQVKVASSALSVLAGHLSRSTALGQVGQIMNLVYGDERERNNAIGSMVGYIGGGQLPGIGLIRDLERNANSKAGNLYRERDMTAAEEELFDPSFLESAEKNLKEMAYNVTGLFGAAGGNYRDNDWLGSKIRLPWGMDLPTYMNHRFFPHLHPNDVVYKELNMLNLLNPPQALMTRTLEGVPMTDDLQKEYNDAYGTVRGSIDPLAVKEFTGSGGATLTVKLPVRVNLPSGLQVRRDKNLVSFDLSVFLGRHTQGKTFIEAARSLMQDPIYRGMQATPEMTANKELKDLPSSVQRSRPAALMMNALKTYYHQLATAELRKSQTPDAIQWQERAQMVIDAETLGAKEKVSAFSDVLGGAE